MVTTEDEKHLELAAIAYMAWVFWKGIPLAHTAWDELSNEEKSRWVYVAKTIATFQKTGTLRL